MLKRKLLVVTVIMFSSRKYSYPPHRRFFFGLHVTPHPLGSSIPEGFVETPSSPAEFPFFLYPHFRTPQKF